jgi:predicted Zn finger-like uncharacterized protein
MGTPFRYAKAQRMITRCPECATAFRVTEEQLDARQGRVRCGHCGEIFDALELLEDEALPAPITEDAAAQADPDAAEPPPVPTDIEPEPVTAAQPDPEGTTALESEPVVVPITAASIAPEPGPPIRPATFTERNPAYVDEPVFGPRKNPRRAAWTALAAVLLIALTLQALFYFRGAIALVWPESKPYIDALCDGLGCEVPLPKRAELMSIETSDLQAEPSKPGVMVLSATLRNRAAFPQAYPALELTLTNETDQPLARRVLAPPDYLKKDGDEGIPTCAGGVASCEVQVRMHLEASSLKASGYRLYLFYP